MSDHAGSGLHYHGYQEKRYGHMHPFLHINHEHEPLSEEPIYRRCYECGKEWTEPALIAAHNAWLDEIGAFDIPNAEVDARDVDSGAEVPMCPECIHDW